MTRIKINHSIGDVVSIMSDGNLGAMEAVMIMLTPKAEAIDPDNGLGGLGPLLFLDTCGIYGTDLYVLFSDICGKQVNKMLAVLRATQLGMFSKDTLKDACSRQDHSGKELVPVEELYLQVKERLTRFDQFN